MLRSHSRFIALAIALAVCAAAMPAPAEAAGPTEFPITVLAPSVDGVTVALAGVCTDGVTFGALDASLSTAGMTCSSFDRRSQARARFRTEVRQALGRADAAFRGASVAAEARLNADRVLSVTWDLEKPPTVVQRSLDPLQWTRSRASTVGGHIAVAPMGASPRYLGHDADVMSPLERGCASPGVVHVSFAHRGGVRLPGSGGTAVAVPDTTLFDQER